MSEPLLHVAGINKSFGGFKNNPSYAHVVFFYETYPQ